MKRLTVIIFATITLCNALYARQFEDLTHHRASISGLLTSSDTWQVDLAYHYMIFPYFGAGGGIGGWDNYFGEGHASGTNWHISSDDENPWNIYLRPSIVLRSPALEIKQVYLGIYAEPGVMLNIPYHSVYIEQTVHTDHTANLTVSESKKISTSNGQWCALDLRAGVYANVGPCEISAGYVISNYDIYSQRRHLNYNGVSFSRFYPRKSLMQGAYLTLSYYFD
ncbi:MAG: hypothetical protein K2I45_01665 [Muribaculaceae bacterium]|nr:hypothetical protein [Muribaculaceae bacterium]